MYKTAQEAVLSLLGHFSPIGLATLFGIDDAHIYRARRGDITPTVERVLRERGLIPPKPRRVRFTADCEQEMLDEINDHCKTMAATHQELLYVMWRLYKMELSIYEFDGRRDLDQIQ